MIGAVHSLFIEREWTLASAESCTGGLISHWITSLSGASGFFRAGLVAYAGQIKIDLLRVPVETIEKYGVVSEETAKAMAIGAMVLMKTDYAVATTGNLGPDTMEGKARGLIYIAVCNWNRTLTRELTLSGSRSENKQQASAEAIRLILELAEANGQDV
ncbi:MAG: CinA family protein [Nitrospira sp.]|nr:CinA family protein [bacterium]MBL7048547.1 CinA family protein [Nitrospira sp.]